MTDGYLLDVGVLIALYDPRHVHHRPVRSWFADISVWATTPVTEAAFVRLLTNPAVMGESLTPLDALAALSAVRHAPGHRYLVDDSSLALPHIDLSPLAGHRQVTDFHLLNLSVQAGLRFATIDARFARALSAEDRAWVSVVPV